MEDNDNLTNLMFQLEDMNDIVFPSNLIENNDDNTSYTSIEDHPKRLLQCVNEDKTKYIFKAKKHQFLDKEIQSQLVSELDILTKNMALKGLEPMPIKFKKITKKSEIQNSPNKKDKRKINNLQRNGPKTIGRAIIKFIKEKKAIVDKLLHQNFDNYDEFIRWINDNNLYNNFVNIKCFREYWIENKNDNVHKRNFIIVCKYFLENYADSYIIEKFHKIVMRKNNKKEIEYSCKVYSRFLDVLTSLKIAIYDPENFTSLS